MLKKCYKNKNNKLFFDLQYIYGYTCNINLKAS